MNSECSRTRNTALTYVLGLGVLLLAQQVWAQAYPTKPVRVIVPTSAGAGADAVARPIMLKVGEKLGQAFVLDFMPGAGGAIGADAVLKSKPDGYTIMQSSNGTMAVLPAFNQDVRYVPERDFAPIVLTVDNPYFLIVHPSVGVKSVKDFIAKVKANPGKIRYGTSGVGGVSHLAGELFNKFADVQMADVPYKGSAPMFTDLLAGRIEVTFSSYNLVEGHVKAGKLWAIASTGSKRQSNAPDVPTMSEQGMGGYKSGVWYGIFAPAGTPRPIVTLLNAEINKALAEPESRQRLGDGAVDANTPEQFAAFVKTDRQRYIELAKTLKINIE